MFPREENMLNILILYHVVLEAVGYFHFGNWMRVLPTGVVCMSDVLRKIILNIFMGTCQLLIGLKLEFQLNFLFTLSSKSVL